MTVLSATRPLQVLLQLLLTALVLLSLRRPSQTHHPSSHLPPAPSNRTLYQILHDDLLLRIHALKTISDPPYTLATGVNRPFLTPTSTAVRVLLTTYLTAAGLSTRVDAAGNLIADLSCATATHKRKVFALGSHFDTVVSGGIWDGIYGVLTAVAAASAIAARPGGVCDLPFDLRVLAFDDEEGNNPFGSTNFGAKAYAGVLDLQKDVADLPALLERYEEMFPEFAAEVGDGSREQALERRMEGVKVDAGELVGFVEVHIEQGPVLEERDMAVGAVEGIAGQTRLVVRVEGRKGHAGTVPMGGRVDAVAAAAEGVGIVERVGRMGMGDGLVATVGVVRVVDGGSNVIAGVVEFSVDVRAPRDEVRTGAVREILSKLEGLERGRGVKVKTEVRHEVGAVGMTEWVVDVVEGVVGRFGREAEEVLRGQCEENCSASFERSSAGGGRSGGRMTSGAGHDTQFMGQVTDIGMIFVRCRDGLSHHPAEHVEDQDAYLGARTLLDVVDAVAARVGK